MANIDAIKRSAAYMSGILAAAGRGIMYFSTADGTPHYKDGDNGSGGDVSLVGMSCVNVKSFGAKGDGVTDDTAAINAAITSIGAGSKALYLPEGTYIISSTLILPKDNFVLFGAGRGASVLMGAVSFTTGDMLQLQSGGDYVTLRDFSITMKSSTARTSGASININGSNDVIIKNIAIFFPYIGISVSGGASKIYISDVDVKVATALTTSANSAGILVNNGGTGDTYIGPNVNIESASGAGRAQFGIRIQSTGYVSMDAVACTAAATGLQVDPGAGVTVLNIFATRCLFDTCNSIGALLSAATATSTIRQVRFTDCWFSGTVAGPGLQSSGTAGGVIDDVAFVNCRFLSNNTHGIQHGYGTNFLIQASTIAGNSTAGSAISDGVNIAAAVSQFSIIGNLIRTVSTFPAFQRYAVNVLAGASNAYSIRGNDFTGAVTQPFFDGGTGTQKVVENNIGGVMAPTTDTTLNLLPITTVTRAGVAIPIPANALNVGTCIRIKCLCSNIATINTTTLTAKLGTANTNADATISGALSAVGTGVADAAFVELDLTVRSIGAAGTVAVMLSHRHGQSATGFAAVPVGTAYNLATINTTVANFLAIYMAASAANVLTIQSVEYEVVKQ